MSPAGARLFGAITLLAALVCFSLAYWQYGRLMERRGEIARIAELRELPMVNLGRGEGAGDLVERRVAVGGTWLHDSQMILRGRARRGSPGVELATPLLPAGDDSAVLVMRGWVPAPDGVSLNAAGLEMPDSGTVAGIAFALEEQPEDGQPVVTNGLTTWRRLDLSSVRAAVGIPIREIVIHPFPDTAAGGYPRVQPLPELGDGPHLSYMIQWIAFGLIALVGGYFYRKQKTT